MCGISGAIALRRGATINRAAIETLAGRLAHRGPDAVGFAHEEDFSFAARRLAITDPTPQSNQPFWDEERSVTLVFNGEIYNHHELREELSGHGFGFRTNSDTEVFLVTYRHWGADCLSRLNGMFTAVLFDRRSHSFMLIRDRIGVKPLYYAVIKDLLVFGSEIKAVIGYPGFCPRLAPEAIIRFLRFRYVPFGDQYYRSLRKLAPGHTLHVNGAHIEERCYWDVPTEAAQLESDPAVISHLIGSSAKLQMRSDPPPVLFLSGGVDSSILALHAGTNGTSNIAEAFTAHVPGAAYDETSAASEVASACNLIHHVVPISPISSLDAARTLIHIKDQPLGMHNELAMAALAREVAKTSKVVICGEGGDELFAGYTRIFQYPFIFLRRRAFGASADAGFLSDPFWHFVLERYFYTPDVQLAETLQPEFQPLLCDEELADWVRRLACIKSLSRFQQLSYFFMKLHLPGLLEMIDATTMAASIEARVPYTDHKLVEAVSALPQTQKLRWRSPLHAMAAAILPHRLWSGICDEPKAVLADAYRAKLPPFVFTQRKKGFPTPLGRWLTDNDEVGSLLFRQGSRLHEFFRADRLWEWYSRFAQHPDDTFGRRVWLLTNLALFLETAL